MDNNLRDLQILALDALKMIDKICEENELNYFMIGGTLLGSIRHKGFIPWDDDIDIAMPRDSYNKLIKLIRENKYDSRFNIVNYKNDLDMRCYFTRVSATEEERKKINFEKNSEIGLILIDIMPLDGTPNNIILRYIYYMKILYLRANAGIANIKYKGEGMNRTLIEKIIIKISKFFKIYNYINQKDYFEKLDKLYSENSWLDSKYSGTLVGAYKIKEIVPTSYWGKGKKYLFEDSYFYGPENYDGYLTHMYEEYNVIPKEKDRKTHF